MLFTLRPGEVTFGEEIEESHKIKIYGLLL